MFEFVTRELARTEEWRTVLSAYHKRDAGPKSPDSEADGWLPRVSSLNGIDGPQLSRLHGKLIALGFLKFEASSKGTLQYQISPLGRQTLERGLEAAPAEALTDE